MWLALSFLASSLALGTPPADASGPEPYALRAPTGEREKRTVAKDLSARVTEENRLRAAYERALERGSTEDLVRAEEALRAARRANGAVLRSYAERFGWFPRSTWSWEAPRDAWLLVRYAKEDPELRARALATMAPLAESGEISWKSYAFLADELAAAASAPQRWGTYGTCIDGVWESGPIALPDSLDERRDAAGIEPFAQYREAMTARCQAFRR